MPKKRDDDPAFRLDHDPEDLVEEGMSEEAAEVDRAETLASTGDADGAFQEIASGSATGAGVDRIESEVSSMRSEALEASHDERALAQKLGAPPDIDENDGDDSWLQDMPEDLK
jgi:hypothetical protein